MIICGDASSMFVMLSPLLSVYGECQVMEWALKSPNMQEFCRSSKGVRCAWVIVLSSLFGSLRGGM